MKVFLFLGLVFGFLFFWGLYSFAVLGEKAVWCKDTCKINESEEKSFFDQIPQYIGSFANGIYKYLLDHIKLTSNPEINQAVVVLVELFLLVLIPLIIYGIYCLLNLIIQSAKKSVKD